MARTLLFATIGLAAGCHLAVGVADLEFKDGQGGATTSGMSGGGGATSSGMSGGGGSGEGGMTGSGGTTSSSGTAGGMTGGGGSGGGGTTTCNSVTECPKAINPCEVRACIDKKCAIIPRMFGPAFDQTAGDCVTLICDGYGNSQNQNEPTDLPDDNNDCTDDLCSAGMVDHPPLAIGTACGMNGTSQCDGAGTCVQCNVASDCPGADDECQTRTCIANTCGVSYTPDLTPVALQTDGDCQKVVCNGAGATKSVDDNADIPVDNIICTKDQCNNGAPSNPPEANGFPCGGSLTCDGAGKCIGCTIPTDCQGTDTFCQTRTCVAQSCGFNYTADGTNLPAQDQVASDCKTIQCNGLGGTKTVADDSDLPIDDGNDCTTETCSNGVEQHPAEPIDTSCASGGGVVCDGAGACVECNSPSVCPQGTVCQAATCVANSCGLNNTPNNDPAPPSEQTNMDCTLVACDGSGGTKNVADPADLPVDNNECTADQCSGMTPSNPDLPDGTDCAMMMGKCQAGVCSVGKPNGDSCSQNGECQSNNCVDDVCCDTACSGLCEACVALKTGGSDGSCSPILANQDPDAECTGTQVCDGTNNCTTPTVTGNHLCSKALGDGDDQHGYGIAADGTDVILVGKFKGTPNFGGGALSNPAGKERAFVVKLDSSCNHVWSKGYGDSSDTEALAVAVDSTGNVLVTGAFKGTPNFGGGSLSNPKTGKWQMFVLKLNSSGNHVWSKSFGADKEERGNGVAVDSADNVLLTGEFKGSIDFGGGALNGVNGKADVFAAKLSSSGSHVWSKRFGDSNDDIGNAVAVDAANNVLLTGEMKGTIDFGGGTLTAPGGGSDVFVAKLDSNGTHVFSNNFGDASHQRGHGIAADTQGNVVLTGEMEGSADFGGGSLSSAGSEDIFVVKLGPTGTHLLSSPFGDGNPHLGHAMTADTTGNISITGEMEGSVDFGGGALSSAGGADIFVVKLDAFFGHLWSKNFGDGGEQRAYGIASNSSNQLWLTGEMKDGANFGGGTRTSAGGFDAFVAHLDE